MKEFEETAVVCGPFMRSKRVVFFGVNMKGGVNASKTCCVSLKMLLKTVPDNVFAPWSCEELTDFA